MSVRVKLAAIVLFVALVPLVVLAWTALGIHEDAFRDRIEELQRRSAECGADLVKSENECTARGLQAVAGNIAWDELSDDERRGALWLIYGQFADAAVAMLFDAGREPIGTGVYLPPERGRDAGGHPAMSAADLDGFRSRIPFDRLARERAAIGPPFALAGSGEVVVPLALALDGEEVGGRPDGGRVLAIGLGLRSTCEQLGQGASGAEVQLLDPRVGSLCRAADGAALMPPDPGLGRLLAGPGPETRMARYRARDGEERLVAVSAAGGPWHVVVQEQLAAAMAPGQRIRRQSLLWIGLALVAALASALVLGAGLSRPIAALADGAREVGRGNFRHRVDIRGRDELAGLGRAFNRMCEEIERRHAEIEMWNRELVARVEARTRELKAAQEQLVDSRKMAAIASLSAGVAHEINNPLTGVLGFTQVLLARARKAGSRDADLLVKVESEAQRILAIVERMQSLARSEESFSPVALPDVIEAALAQTGAALQADDVTVGRSFAPRLPDVLGNAAQLEQVIVQLIDNARRAMREQAQRRLDVELDQIEGELLRVVVRDSGRGIPAEIQDRVFEPFFTTKDEWRSHGMGLAVAFRVIEAHRGRIRIDSRPGTGTAMILILPVARRGAHLA